MSSEEVLEKVKGIIVEQLGVAENAVTMEASFIDDLGADSLDIVELVMALEEEFDIEIPDSDAEKVVTVEDVVEYIKENVKGRKEDLKLIDSLEKAFRSLTKYNIADKLEEIAEILIHLVNKTTLREKSTAKKMYELSSKLKGFNMIPSTLEERQIEETDVEIKKLTMELGL